MNRPRALMLALAPQVLLLLSMIAREEITLRTGVPVVLEVRPYDPMDMLSGRYLAVPLAIEQLDADQIAHPTPPLHYGQAVWVGLKPGEDHWTPLSLAAEPPDAGTAQAFVWLRGRINDSWSGDGVIKVAYDLDRFYIPEDAADPSRLESGQTAARKLALVVRVNSQGRGSIADLLVDGQPYAQWNRAQR